MQDLEGGKDFFLTDGEGKRPRRYQYS